MLNALKHLLKRKPKSSDIDLSGFLESMGRTVVANNSHNIREVKSLKEIRHAINGLTPQKTVVAIDLDETVHFSPQFLGSSAHSSRYFKTMLERKQDLHTAFHAAFGRFYYAQQHTKVHLAEGRVTIEFISELHQQGFKVIFVTARGAKIALATERQLREHDIPFNQCEEFKGISLDLSKHIPYAQAENGIIYTQGGNKGVCLEQFLRSLELHDQFENVIAIDDKLGHLQEIATAALGMNKTFIGFRYGALDNLKRDLPLAVAELQYRLHIPGIRRFISDETALIILKIKEFFNFALFKRSNS